MPELPDVFAEFFDNKILNDTLIDPNRYVFRKAGASSHSHVLETAVIRGTFSHQVRP